MTRETNITGVELLPREEGSCLWSATTYSLKGPQEPPEREGSCLWSAHHVQPEGPKETSYKARAGALVTAYVTDDTEWSGIWATWKEIRDTEASAEAGACMGSQNQKKEAIKDTGRMCGSRGKSGR